MQREDEYGEREEEDVLDRVPEGEKGRAKK